MAWTLRSPIVKTDTNTPHKKGAGSTNSNSVSIPIVNYIISGTPVWRNLTELSYLLKCYEENPVVQAVINIKAKALSNVIFSVKDLSTGEITPLNEYEKDKGKLRDLLAQPNPLETTTEWLRNLKVNQEVFGNSYVYGLVPSSYEDDFTYNEIQSLKNIPPYLIAPVLTGKWLNATTKSEIISRYDFTGLNGKVEPLHTETVMHTNGINIRLDQDFTQGKSKLIALKKPISNIDSAYEARNVLIENRGADGIISSDAKDEAMGTVPLNDDAKKEVLEEHKRTYGLMEGQFPFMFSTQPLKFQKTGRSTKDLMLFEEVAEDGIAVCNAYEVPPILVKYYFKEATFENQDASEKKFYDSTIIPETNDLCVALNNFFKTKDLGIELIASFDHLNVLQINKKEEAETKQIKEETSRSAFMMGAITYDDYLIAIGMPTNPKIGSRYIWELDDKMLNAIKSMKNERTTKN